MISNYYEPLLEEGHEEFERLGWESAAAQNRRYDIMLETVGFDGMSLLDVGCGLGSLMTAVKNRGWKTEYRGIDLMPEMVEEAREKHPEQEWHCGDLFSENPFNQESFDIVYASGIFNLDLGNNLDFLDKALGCFSSLAKSHICFNLLSEHSMDKEDGYFYYREVDVRRVIARNPELEQGRLRIEHSYLPNDMTVIISL